MRRLREALARLTGFVTPRPSDDDVREELQAHLEMETEENIRRGMDPAEARRQALLASGGLTQATEAVREQRSLPWIDVVTADVRYALRALRRNAGFTAVVVLTLALGIGANTAIFSVVRGVILKPLPHRDGDRLLYLRQSRDGPGGANLNFSVPEVRDLRTGAHAFAALAEYSPWGGTLEGNDGALSLSVGLVTGNYFDVMGLGPVLGRLTGPQDDGPGVPPVMVLTYPFWRNYFGGDSAIVGRQVQFAGKSVTVIGVLQPAPFFPNRIDALCNMVISAHHMSANMVEGRVHRMTEVVARLAPGATVQGARAEVETIYGRLQASYPDAYEAGSHFRIAVIPFKQVMGERARLTVWLLVGVAGFILVISAASVGNLTLMRGVRREHELVVRAALGAGLTRLRRLLLTENLVLALLGAAVGTLLAVDGVRLLTSLIARYSARANEIRLDTVVLAFTLGLSVLVAFLLSLIAPLPHEGGLASRILAGGQRFGGGGSSSKRRLQRSLVVLQVAVSVVLLAGAGLLTRTVMSLSEVDTGLQAEEVLTMEVSLITPAENRASGTDPAARAAAIQRYVSLRDEIAALPGVIAVGVGSTVPLRTSDIQFQIGAEGRATGPGDVVPRAEWRFASPEYFQAAGVPLLAGRAFASTDMEVEGSARVAIVNQAFAQRVFPGQDPLGQRVRWDDPVLQYTSVVSQEWRTIVGVVGNTQDGGLDVEPRAAMFWPLTQVVAYNVALVIRCQHDAAGLAGTVTRIVRHAAPAGLIENVLTVRQIKDESVAPRRLNAILVAAFGLLAVIVSAVGIAGVLGFSVSMRTNEIGIRMSLGADAGTVQRMILKEGGVLLAVGLALGVAGAFALTSVIRGLLFGVEPHDPITFLGVALLMAAIGLAASWIPARRAARIDPAIAMRAQ